MNLYLAEIELERRSYMGDLSRPNDRSRSQKLTRLVQAESIDEARQKIDKTFEISDPYSISQHVVSCSISGVIT